MIPAACAAQHGESGVLTLGRAQKPQLCARNVRRRRLAALVAAVISTQCAWCWSSSGFAGVTNSRVGARRSRALSTSGAPPLTIACNAWETMDEFIRDPVVSCIGWTVVFASLTIIRVAVSDDKDTPRAFLETFPGAS